MISSLLLSLLLAAPARAQTRAASDAASASIPRVAPPAAPLSAPAPLSAAPSPTALSAPSFFPAPVVSAAPLAAASPAPAPLFPAAAAPAPAPARALAGATAAASLPSKPAERAAAPEAAAAPASASEPASRIRAFLRRLADPFGTKTAETAPVSEAARLDREFSRIDFWSRIGPSAKSEIEGLRAKKLSKAETKEYVREEVNAAFARIESARGTKNIGLHFNLHGGTRAGYVGAGIRASKGDIALRYTTSGDMNDKVYFFQTGRTGAYAALDASNGELLFFPSRMGHVLSAFAVDAPVLKAALADGRIDKLGSISMDFHKGMRGVPYSAFLAPPLEVFAGTARKLGLKKLSRDEETLATARFLEAALTSGGAYVPR